MSRYIDAVKLKSHYAWWQNEDQEAFDCIVDEQPTADVVEVVRCKDCEHFEAINNDDHGWCKSISDLPCGISVRYDNDYCSYGERAEE